MPPVAANDNLPRLMDRAAAARYCDCHPATFSRWVAAGLMPSALPGLRKWDRVAIDAKISTLSGLNDNKSLDDPYLAWKAADDARHS